MKIYWMSNSPMVGSGYGVQTALFCSRLVAAGHEVIVRGNYGHNGNVARWNGMSILPQWWDGHGVGVMQHDIDRIQPDAAVCLYDIWVFNADDLAGVTAYAPIDHLPMPPLVMERLPQARHQWAMSRFAEAEMRRIGLEPDYVPHCVDTTVYKPGNRQMARQAWGIDETQFTAVMCAANKGYPSRKSLDRVLLAWGKFVREVEPRALLYIHTNPAEIHHGIDLITCAKMCGIPEDNLRFPDLYQLNAGQYTPEKMCTLYNAADVLLAPSAGEGFGIPVIEAQAAGCPVVVTNFTAQAELCGAGWGIDVTPDDLTYTLQNSFQVMPDITKIYEACRAARDARGDAALRQKARDFAMEYDADKVFREYALPALERQVERERTIRAKREARTAARRSLRDAKVVATEAEAVEEMEPAWT